MEGRTAFLSPSAALAGWSIWEVSSSEGRIWSEAVMAMEPTWEAASARISRARTKNG